MARVLGIEVDGNRARHAKDAIRDLTVVRNVKDAAFRASDSRFEFLDRLEFHHVSHVIKTDVFLLL